MKRIVFVTGGARSGKSAFALRAAGTCGGRKAYVATAQGLDDEMRERIERHREQRGNGWDTIEEPLGLAEAVGRLGGEYETLVIDCLTLWVSNLMLAGAEVGPDVDRFLREIARVRHQGTGEVIIVSNEVGMGIVPDNDLARAFRDAAGRVNQRVADAADDVYVVVSGIPVKIK